MKCCMDTTLPSSPAATITSTKPFVETAPVPPHTAMADLPRHGVFHRRASKAKVAALF